MTNDPPLNLRGISTLLQVSFWRVRGWRMRGHDGRERTYLLPTPDVSDLPRQPLEMFFTLDVSGSERPVAGRGDHANLPVRAVWAAVCAAGGGNRCSSAPAPGRLVPGWRSRGRGAAGCCAGLTTGTAPARQDVRTRAGTHTRGPPG